MPTGPDEKIAQAYDAYAPALMLYARQWIDSSAAEDVIQKVFMKLIAGGRLPANFRTWLYRCVRNEAISAGRSDRRRSQREYSKATEPLFRPSPDAAMDAIDVQQALSSLPPEIREVVTLRIWSGLTLAEISAVTGSPISTIHDQYKAALAAMKQKLEAPCRNP
jgi:RNA polymerase sigma-70 factor (ECF subfamily)